MIHEVIIHNIKAKNKKFKDNKMVYECMKLFQVACDQKNSCQVVDMQCASNQHQGIYVQQIYFLRYTQQSHTSGPYITDNK